MSWSTLATGHFVEHSRAHTRANGGDILVDTPKRHDPRSSRAAKRRHPYSLPRPPRRTQTRIWQTFPVYYIIFMFIALPGMLFGLSTLYAGSAAFQVGSQTLAPRLCAPNPKLQSSLGSLLSSTNHELETHVSRVF